MRRSATYRIGMVTHRHDTIMMHQRTTSTHPQPIRPNAKNCINGIYKENYGTGRWTGQSAQEALPRRSHHSLLFSSTRGRDNDTVNITTHLNTISEWLTLAEWYRMPIRRGGTVFINIKNMALKMCPSSSNEQLFLSNVDYFPSSWRRWLRRRQVAWQGIGNQFGVTCPSPLCHQIATAVRRRRERTLHTAYSLTTGQLNSSMIHRLSISSPLWTRVIRKCTGFLTANPFTIPNTSKIALSSLKPVICFLHSAWYAFSYLFSLCFFQYQWKNMCPYNDRYDYCIVSFLQ